MSEDRETKYLLQLLELIKERCNEARIYINNSPRNADWEAAGAHIFSAIQQIDSAEAEVTG